MNTRLMVAMVSGAAVAALALLNAQAAGGLTGTPHDFHAKTWGVSGTNTLNQLCVPCHTPHGAMAVDLALWNHELPDDADFTKWDGASLGPASLACLGCHDGQTGLDSFNGQTTGAGSAVMGDANNPLVNPRSLVGTDLTDDHPVGVFYSVTNGQASTSWGTVITTLWGTHAGVASSGSGSLPLYGDGTDGRYTVECSSCHTPHSNQRGSFLRIQNNLSSRPSALCVTCHLSKE